MNMYKLALDYQIDHIINNYKFNGCVKYDYVRSEIRVRTWDLCYLLRKELNIDINPETPFETDWKTAYKAWKIFEKDFTLVGTYGDKYLNEW